MKDKRLTHRLTEYWNTMRGDASLPSWTEFDSRHFGDIWKKCCGWKVDTTNTSTIVYTYEHVGEFVKEFAGDLMGKQITSQLSTLAGEHPPGELLASHFQSFPAARILQKIDRVVHKPAIVIEEGRVIDGNGKNIRFRSCLIPFGTQDGLVTHMVLGLSWKEY